MIKKSLDEIGKEDIQSLIDEEVIEDRGIEYKQALPGNSDANKKEFLADVSSFANAGGGDVLFGVEAKNGLPAKICGLANFDEDKEKLRLESILREGIAPRISGIHLKVVPGFQAGSILILRVPRSWAAPHMVSFKNSSRFYSRTSAGKYQLDVSEIRSAFEFAGQLPNRIAEWRDERLGRLVANEGPFRISEASWLVAHLVPVASHGSNFLNVEQLISFRGDFPVIDASGYNERVNLDGIVHYSSDNNSGSARGYTQLFRSGAIEAVCGEVVRKVSGRNCIASVWYEEEIMNAVSSFLSSFKKIGVEAPVVFMLSFFGVKGAVISEYFKDWNRGIKEIDRDPLVLPDIVIENLDCDVSEALKPVFDLVWNACGYPRSKNYDSEGKWRRRS